MNACGADSVRPSDLAPKIACPAESLPAQATDAGGAIVTYPMATATLGTPPLLGPSCTPPSGSKFPIGSTDVLCTVADAKARIDSCTVRVVVAQAAPKLALTRFLAFGDSITAGEVVSEGDGLLRGLRIDLSVAYPTDLQRDLDIRYQAQQPYVFNAGAKGETTAGGVRRLPDALSGFPQAQVVLFLEGANDLSGGDPASVQPAVTNLATMVQAAKSGGLRVMVGTLPPQNPNACTGSAAFPGCIARTNDKVAMLIVPYNNGLTAMAAAEGVSLVDVYREFNGDVTTLIDFDGLHPTSGGYRVIADAFFKVIQQTLEVPVTPTAIPTSGSPFFFSRPRRH